MKIESSTDSYIGSVAGGPHKAASAPAAGGDNAAGALAAAQPQAGVTVTLSMTSQAMSSAGGEVFNAQKVEAVKLAIANGTFQVNPEAIADKMLSNAAEMLANTRG